MKRHAATIPFLTPAELAGRWRISRATISRMVQDGRMKALRIGGQLRITVQEVEFIEKFGERN